MSEIAKTGVFVAVGVVVLAVGTLAGWTGNSWKQVTPDEAIGTPLFEDFDPLDVTRLEIVKYDEGTGTLQPFEVAQVNDLWSIPSHSDYPADAEDQLADAATSLMGHNVLGVASESPGDHELYGVIDPDPKTLKPGTVGVGTRVTMKDEDGKPLLAMVIGKQEEGNDKLRYVRRAGQDPVYTMEISTDKLSTKFEDWIEDDLLKLNSWDITQVEIGDHSVDEVNQALLQRGKMRLKYDDTGDPKWQMAEDQALQQGQWASVPMAEDEELDTSKLDDLKSALDDLKIVDVQRKPAGLSANLTAGENFDRDGEAMLSLMGKGFYVATVDDRVELVSNEGDVRCLMKDGVQYVLRFGNVADTGAAAPTEKTGDEADTEDSSSDDLNRYIFVMAEFRADTIPSPELEALPEVPETPAETEEGDTGEGDAAEGDAEATPAPEEGANSADEAATDEDKADETAAERERIEKENQRKQEEYDEKIADGEKNVKELNARFADWYYVISDEVYQKIHLGRDQIIKKKEKEEETGDETAAEDPASGETAAGTDTLPEAPPAGPLEEFEKIEHEGLDDGTP